MVGYGQDIGGVEVKVRDTRRHAAEKEEAWMTTPKMMLRMTRRCQRHAGARGMRRRCLEALSWNP